MTLEETFEQIKSAASSSEELLSPAQFETLGGVYKDELASLTASTWNTYNLRPEEKVLKRSFQITSPQKAALNREGRETKLNLMLDHQLPTNEENHRLREIHVKSITLEIKNAEQLPTGVDISVRHSGIGVLAFREEFFQFTHSNEFSWKSVLPVRKGMITEVEQSSPSDAGSRLLGELLRRKPVENLSEALTTYSLPPAWADLLVSLTFSPSGSNGAAVKIVDIEFEFSYDFYQVQQDLVVVRIDDIEDARSLVLCTQDVKGRGPGVGSFSRVFAKGTKIRLEAQLVVGSRRFLQWRKDGVPINKNVIEFEASRGTWLSAVHE